MKKMLAIIVAILCHTISIAIILVAASAVLALIQTIYSSSPAIFWVVLFLGGSFGLGIFWWLVPILATFVISRSQKINLSKRGIRYIVLGSLSAFLYLGNIVGAFVNPNAGNRAVIIVCSLLIIAYSLTLIWLGRETAIDEYVEPIKKVGEIPSQELSTLKALHDSGVITDEEFQAKERKLLDL